MRIRKYINELLLDQLPVLGEVQRYLDELAIMDPPAPTSLASSGFVLEQTPAVTETLARGHDWDEVAAFQKESAFTKEGDRADADLRKLASMYAEDGVQDIIDPTGSAKAAAAAEFEEAAAAEIEAMVGGATGASEESKGAEFASS